MQLLVNYYALLDKVDDLCRKTIDKHRKDISCRPGCAACCRHLTIFPVEGFALAESLAELSPGEIESIRNQARSSAPSDSCPLLADDRCLLYEARPIICRTHGLPILFSSGEQQQVDCCPLNFQGVESLPGDAVIDLERVNSLLTAINGHFLANAANYITVPERLTIAEALLLEISACPASEL